MSFKDIAVPLTERGFHVAPLIPKSKRPLKMSHGDHFDAATTDPKQIELWSKQEPDANAALIPDEIFLFLETDSESELKEACKDLPAEIWDTTRVTSGRPDRAYYIFKHTNRTRHSPIKDKAYRREGKENLFEFKSFRTYVVAPGSIHPQTKAPYIAYWRNVLVMPDCLHERLCDLLGASKSTVSSAMSDDTRQQPISSTNSSRYTK